jgi:hypothetical protein
MLIRHDSKLYYTEIDDRSRRTITDCAILAAASLPTRQPSVSEARKRY